VPLLADDHGYAGELTDGLLLTRHICGSKTLQRVHLARWWLRFILADKSNDGDVRVRYVISGCPSMALWAWRQFRLSWERRRRCAMTILRLTCSRRYVMATQCCCLLTSSSLAAWRVSVRLPVRPPLTRHVLCLLRLTVAIIILRDLLSVTSGRGPDGGWHAADVGAWKRCWLSTSACPSTRVYHHIWLTDGSQFTDWHPISNITRPQSLQLSGVTRRCVIPLSARQPCRRQDCSCRETLHYGRKSAACMQQQRAWRNLLFGVDRPTGSKAWINTAPPTAWNPRRVTDRVRCG